MSDTVAELKAAEIKAAEEEEQRMLKEMEADACPVCSKLTSSFEYLAALPGFTWVECTGCGTIFCPPSVRRRKLEKMSQNTSLIKTAK